jgi:hypothetical protein
MIALKKAGIDKCIIYCVNDAAGMYETNVLWCLLPMICIFSKPFFFSFIHSDASLGQGPKDWIGKTKTVKI